MKSRRKWYAIFILFVLISFLQGTLSVPIIAVLYDGYGSLTASEWIYIITAYPFARAIGQLGLIIPGGLGVREGAYVLLTSSIIGIETAALVSIWLRFLSIFAEIIFFFLVFSLSSSKGGQRF